MKEEKMNVYRLMDPKSNQVRYVGITKNTILHRLATHIKDAKVRARKSEYLSKKDKWILGLIKEDMKPIAELIIGNIKSNIAIDMEAELIKSLGRVNEGGVLFNVDAGGHYHSNESTPWNKGIEMNKAKITPMKLNQPNRKIIYRFTKDGVYLDNWLSIRTMCDELKLDRRAVQRVLAKKPNFNSHKGFLFSYDESAPCIVNKSTLKRGSSSPHAKKIDLVDISSGDIKTFLCISDLLLETGLTYAQMYSHVIFKKPINGKLLKLKNK